MGQKNRSVYLNDHLAGSVAAIEMFDTVIEQSEDDEVVQTLRSVRESVVEDQQTLRGLMRQLGVDESRVKKGAARAGQKVSLLKLRIEASEHGHLQLLHILDSLSLGIEGKKALWLSLAVASEVDETLRIADYEGLRQRADEQVATLVPLRVKAARRALA